MKNNYTYKQKYQLAESNWDKLSIDERNFVVGFMKEAYPSKTKYIIESKWYNTFMDIVGIFDPTGVVDLVNGISYIRQGEYLFGFLSIVSAVPYLGDSIAKPVMGMLKIGAPGVKIFKDALALQKAGNAAEAAAMLSKASEMGGVLGNFVSKFGKIGKKLKDIVNRIPGGKITKGLRNTIIEWIDLFTKGAEKNVQIRKFTATLASKMTQLKPEQQVKRLEILMNASKKSGIFSRYSKKLTLVGQLKAGMPQLLSGNRSIRALMRTTKTYAGFLDYLGHKVFTEPDTLVNNMGKSEFERKMAEYLRTPEAQQNFADDYGAGLRQYNTGQPTNEPQKSNSGLDMFSSYMTLKLLKGLANRLV